ncbi:hypothetical protein [Undibacterium flavidum]|uniref:Preprotein translocase subunit SecG n=1 Tax=Undibacterium flavidum TaxID=2762297 RepID=A0ABR6YFM8_9BURK|nr:hypothetical protein [Undibacterium flavidum]MBC3875369.1 hypothetical protein [Undibacterium flavidum]
MWKALVGFLVFAAIALFFIFKAGDKMDMQGEAGAHAGAASEHVSAPAASAAASTPVPAPVVDAAASTASAPSTPVAEANPAAASASASK